MVDHRDQIVTQVVQRFPFADVVQCPLQYVGILKIYRANVDLYMQDVAIFFV